MAVGLRILLEKRGESRYAKHTKEDKKENYGINEIRSSVILRPI